MKKRSQARMLALQAMCLFESVGDAFAERLNDFLRDPANREDLGIDETAERIVAFARRIAVDAWAAHAEHDRLLDRNVPQWPVARMAPVDRNILRIGLYEILRCPDVPAPVAINEAIELAKRFGDRESPAFVNGVLDAFRRELEDAQPAADEPQRGGAATDTTDATGD